MYCIRNNFKGRLGYAADVVSGYVGKQQDSLLARFNTTVGVERTFSVASHILSQKRMRTTDKFFEEQLFAHSNVDLVPVLRKKHKFDDLQDDK